MLCGLNAERRQISMAPGQSTPGSAESTDLPADGGSVSTQGLESAVEVLEQCCDSQACCELSWSATQFKKNQCLRFYFINFFANKSQFAVNIWTSQAAF